MTVVITLMIALIPILAVLYPFMIRRHDDSLIDNETSARNDLELRWDSAISGLKTTELEMSLGALGKDDYAWLRERYLTDAATVMKSMRLRQEDEAVLLESVDAEVQDLRNRIFKNKEATDGV